MIQSEQQQDDRTHKEEDGREGSDGTDPAVLLRDARPVAGTRPGTRALSGSPPSAESSGDRPCGFGPLVQVLPAHTRAEAPHTRWPISGLKDVLMNNKSTTAVHF